MESNLPLWSGCIDWIVILNKYSKYKSNNSIELLFWIKILNLEAPTKSRAIRKFSQTWQRNDMTRRIGQNLISWNFGNSKFFSCSSVKTYKTYSDSGHLHILFCFSNIRFKRGRKRLDIFYFNFNRPPFSVGCSGYCRNLPNGFGSKVPSRRLDFIGYFSSGWKSLKW